LASLDGTRIYSNFGKLGARLSRRLATMLDLAPEQVVLTSSGTAALVGAILGTAGRARPERPLCLLPSYTFSATALAAELCGYRIHFVDIDQDSWVVDPAKLAAHPLLDQTGLVLAVLPYGLMRNLSAWDRFQTETGVPVLVDGAAAFEQVVAAPPVDVDLVLTLSFHATKAFATGEGGAVLCFNRDMAEGVYRAINFGMLGDRACRAPAINGKMSEYHAAVGLAELDGWDQKSGQFSSVIKFYRRVMEQRGLSRNLVTAPDVASCYVLFQVDSAEESEALRGELDRRGIEHRLWYGGGLHLEPYFTGAEKDDLATTESLASRVIGLPMAPDLREGDMVRIAEAAAAILA
jgi:dTDP-4-amino-4,6-dideoxygalactose transaminase